MQVNIHFPQNFLLKKLSFHLLNGLGTSCWKSIDHISKSSFLDSILFHWSMSVIMPVPHCFDYCLFAAAAAAKSLQLCPTLCDPIDGSPPGSPIPGILQARTLEWGATAFSNAWKWKVKVKVKSCPTLSDPMDCSLPGSFVHGIFQARVLEWGATAFSAVSLQ